MMNDRKFDPDESIHGWSESERKKPSPDNGPQFWPELGRFALNLITIAGQVAYVTLKFLGFMWLIFAAIMMGIFRGASNHHGGGWKK